MKKFLSLRNQRGAGFLSSLIFLTALGLLATAGLKSLPVYLEFWSVQSALKSITQNQTLEQDIRNAFDRHARIDNIESVNSSDLMISHGEVSVAYQKVVPLYSNISLLFDFTASSSE